jgi:hypothetical protein
MCVHIRLTARQKKLHDLPKSERCSIPVRNQKINIEVGARNRALMILNFSRVLYIFYQEIEGCYELKENNANGKRFCFTSCRCETRIFVHA